MTYTYTGVIPTGGSSHSEIQDGESWTATYLIDDSNAVDTSTEVGFGNYVGLITSASVVFSGGYAASVGQDVDVSNTVQIFDDLNIGGSVLEAVSVKSGEGSGILSAQYSFHGGDGTLINGVGLIPVGTQFTPSGTTGAGFQFFFRDPDLADQTVSYNYSTPGTTSFSISGVPEPGSAAFVGIGFACLFARRRRI